MCFFYYLVLDHKYTFFIHIYNIKKIYLRSLQNTVKQNEQNGTFNEHFSNDEIQ